MSDRVKIFAETLTPQERKRARFSAIMSACFGSIPAVMLDSAVIIIFAGMLGVSDSFKIMTTSMNYLAYPILLIPVAFVSEKLGYKRTLCMSVYVSILMFLLLAASPFIPAFSKQILIFSCLAYALTMPFYLSSWFPLLDTILLKEERGHYFSTMRFSWQLVAFIYIFLSGVIIGDDPPIWLLQIIIAVSALLMYGRVYFVSRIPSAPTDLMAKRPDFKTALRTSASNSPLAGFSVYLFCLYLASYATVPLAYIYLTEELSTPKNVVVIISSFVMIGTTVGYFIAGYLIKKYGTKKLLLVIHFLFSATNLGLFFCSASNPYATIVITILLTFFGVLGATSSIITSTEMLALARPGNKAMAMAFCGTFYYAGMGGSRLITSLVIDSGLLAPVWYLGAMRFTKYQTLFLFYACAVFIACIMLVIVPAIIPKHDDYYEPN